MASDFDLVLGAIALALDEDGLGVMQQTVEQRRGEHGVLVEDVGPVLVDAVGRDQRGTAFVAVADDLEQTVGAELVDGQVAELIDAQDPGLDVVVQGLLDAAAGLRGGQRIDDVGRR